MKNPEHQAKSQDEPKIEYFGKIKIEHHYPIVDSVRVHYTESGNSGSRVIILGGLPFYAWEGFVGFIKPFAKNHKVCVFEYLGLGESRAFTDREHNFDNVAEVLHKTIQQEGLEPAHIVGLSFGGGLALHLAAKYPKDVKSLALTGVPIELPKIFRKGRQFLKKS